MEPLEGRLLLSGDMVLRWHSALWTALRNASLGGPIIMRAAAMVQAAVYDTAKMKHMVFGLLAFVLFFGAVGNTRSAHVHTLFDLSTPTGGPFPSNWFTVPDSSQNTGQRVDLPLPDPGTNPSDYHDAQVLNTLDGFSMQPRLSIPFDGAIDVNTVNDKTVFLISLGDTLNRDQHQGGEYIPAAVGTSTGTPAVQGCQSLIFQASSR